MMVSATSSLYSSSQTRSNSDKSNAGHARGQWGSTIDYRAETEQLLAELERRLATCGSHKDKLVKVVATVQCFACYFCLMLHV